MMRETTEKSGAQRTAHAMCAAAIRMARERAGEDADPALAYGCVDWFRYDVASPQKVSKASGHLAERLRSAVHGSVAAHT